MDITTDKYNIANNIADIGIVFTDANGLIIELNAYLQNLLGISIENVKEMPIWEFDYNILIDEQKEKLNKKNHFYSIQKIIKNKKTESKNKIFRSIIKNIDGKNVYVERKIDFIKSDKEDYFVIIYKNINSILNLENDVQFLDKNLSEVLNYSKTVHYKQDIKTNKFVYLSKSVEKLLGYTKKEFEKLKFADYLPLVHPDDKELFKSAYSKPSKYAIEIQYRLRSKSGEYKYLSDYHRVIFDVDDKPQYLIGNLRDIALQKKFEEELKESREHYKIIVENINDLVVKVDNLGRILYASPNYCKLFNENLDDLIGKKYIYLVHEDDRNATEKAIEKLFSPPHTCYIEQRAWTTYGWRWLAWSDRAILDEDGAVAEIIGVGRDITKRKRMEEAVKKSELDYRGLFENAMSAIIIFEPRNEIILDANKIACELYGFEKDEFIGMSIQNISKDVSRGRKEINNTFNVKRNHRFETIHFNKNHEELYIEVNASLINFADSEAILSINHDISYIKNLENDLDEANNINEIIFNSGNITALFIDDKYNIYRSNNQAAALFGYNKDNFDKMSFSDLLTDESKIKLAHIYNTNDTANVDCEFQKSNSKKFNAVMKIKKLIGSNKGLVNIEFHEINEK